MTYEYQCVACSHEWEAEQKITEPALVDCPKCSKKTAQRLISKSAFILNGAGWFKSGGYVLPFLLLFRGMMMPLAQPDHIKPMLPIVPSMVMSLDRSLATSGSSGGSIRTLRSPSWKTSRALTEARS